MAVLGLSAEGAVCGTFGRWVDIPPDISSVQLFSPNRQGWALSL